MAKKTKQTPMMEQYLKIKESYPDAFLFYRLGDFYELFHEDAIQASKILEITLTSRNKNADNPIPMCGVPYHSSTEYIKRLIEAGYKVAICEQMEDPKQAKGMVKREVVRVVTPGTILEDDAIPTKENNYLACIHIGDNGYYLSYIDISTGELYLTKTTIWNQLVNEVKGINPSEVVIDSKIDSELLEKLKQHLGSFFTLFESNHEITHSWKIAEPTNDELINLNMLYGYLESIYITNLEHIKEVERYELSSYMQMNYYAKSQLELTRSLRSQKKKGSLLDLIDKTKTAMGGRKLHQWLDKPLLDMNDLTDRHQKVENLMGFYFERVDLMDSLSQIYDLERLVTKISLGNATARDLNQLRNSLQGIPRINKILEVINNHLAHDVNSTSFKLLDEYKPLLEYVDSVLVDDPPISITEGNIIKDKVNEQLDTYRDALENGQKWLSELQKREREQTGLKTLKVGYNKVFGYYIEISRLQAANFNDDRYIRKQTLTNAERYITEELKEIEATILGAQEKSTSLEYDLFIVLREHVAKYVSGLQELAHEVATLDVLVNFANISESEDYVRAELTHEAKSIELEDSRHPVVESLIGKANFVPNSLSSDDDRSLFLLTGPNMSGKSTFMRQIAFCVILNQIGCFVPAKRAKLPIIDKIFTRIGSSDDTTSGQSTFMVEMMETNVALEEATENSLLLFDEIGRGTATFDGMALAEAIIKYIAKNVKALTIFSTHYHELTELDKTIDEVKNIHVGAQEYDGNLIFLHKVLDGPADKSYGIHVAKLAGLPESVLEESQEILVELETNAKNLRESGAVQLDLFDEREAEVIQEVVTDNIQSIVDDLRSLNINQMTPIEAMQKLYEWNQEL
ncbi:DNA mismatch repair protein MutS [Aerococcaceae bacterium INB8]|uniref:DNA mismatch repair protein MutS n=1 Tax=Ruoffia halotolerans TaxID=2748684 RepID=A0A839A696_9LACT|nr:DNA mismatch repair protein MutS [Ruoffia halotolerans]MBA5729340.1 DNA mismatch repair protein MutS [Ruoffia halotolerans]